MPRIRCHYVDCINLEERYCGASRIEIEPEDGCLTYAQFDAVATEDWDEEDLEEMLEDDDESLYSDDDLDDDWLSADD